MGDYSTYDAGLPCKNPACKSHGSPHPFCKCYGNMAEGGDVWFCAEKRDHNPDCEYFADGGSVSFDSLKDDSESQPQAQQQQQQPKKFDDLKEDAPSEFDAMEDDSDKYSTPGQQIATGIEGAAQGIAGPLAALAETKLLGIKPEEINARQAANPWVHGLSEAGGLAGSMFVGTGEAALAAKAADAVAHMAELGKVGSAVIKGAISNGLIQTGDEVSKWILGQGDPSDAVGAVLSATAFGGLMSGAGQKAANGLKNIVTSKVGNKLSSYLAGIANASQNSEGMRDVADNAVKKLLTGGPNPEGLSFDLYEKGKKAFDNAMESVTKNASPAAGAFFGHSVGGTPGEVVGYQMGKHFSKHIEPILEKIAKPAAKKFVTPIALKLLSENGTTGLMDALGHADSMATGFKSVKKGIDSLFTGALNSGISAYGSEKNRDKLDEYIKNGGVDQQIEQKLNDQNSMQGFAHGGDVTPKPIESNGVERIYPEQNMIMNMAKGRISNYLSSLRPSEGSPKLAFDSKPDNRKQKKSYDKALDIANAPLGILEEIHKGTVTPEHIKHLNSMHPEVSGLLQKEITKKIIDYQMDGKRPSSKVRQGLSMLMGTALSSEFLPQSIQAAQSVFVLKSKQQDAQPAKTSAGNKSKLSKSDQSYLTGPQALQRRSQKI